MCNFVLMYRLFFVGGHEQCVIFVLMYRLFFVGGHEQCVILF